MNDFIKKNIAGIIIGICLTITAGSMYMTFNLWSNLNAIEASVNTRTKQQEKLINDTFKQIVEILNQKIPQG